MNNSKSTAGKGLLKSEQKNNIIMAREREQTESLTNMKTKELFNNSWDIGLASGVLQGIELTQTLLPNQKKAIADARKALERVAERNQAALEGQAAKL